MFNKFVRNHTFDLLVLITIFVISVLIFYRPLKSAGYVSWMDDSQLWVLNMDGFNTRVNFTYADDVSGLMYNSNVILSNFVLNKLFVPIRNIISDNHFASFLWIFLPYFTLYISLYFSYFLLFDNKKVSYLLTTFFIFSKLNFTQIAYGWDSTTYSQAFGFLFTSFFIKYLKCHKSKYLIYLTLVSVPAFINIAHFYSVLICVVVYFVSYAVINSINIRDIFFKYRYLLLVPLFIISINLYWILPNFPMSKGADADYGFKNIYSSEFQTAKNTFISTSSFSLFEPFSDLFAIYNSTLYSVLFLLFLLLVFYYVFKNINLNADIKLTLFMYLTVFGLSMGERFKPLWGFFHLIPGSFIVRSPQLKFFPISFFFLSILLGLVTISLKRKLPLYSLIVLILVGVLAFRKGDLFSYWKNIQLPSDYNYVVSYLNKPENRFESVIDYPPIKTTPQITWRNNVYSYSPIRSLIVNPYIHYYWGDSFVPTYLKNSYKNDSKNLPVYLGNGGVKFILSHKEYSNISTFDFTNMGGLEPVLEGDNLSLYKIVDEYYKPLFYVSNSEPVEFHRISPIFYEIKTKSNNLLTFNRQYDKNLNLYDRSELAKLHYFDCKFSIGKMNLCDLMILKAKPVEKTLPNKTNKNDWFLPSETSSSYILYYVPQIHFYIGLIMSLLTLVVLIFGLFLIFRYERRENLRC